MKKILLILMSVLLLVVLSGCFEGKPSGNDSGEKIVETNNTNIENNVEDNNEQEKIDEALAAIRAALKDEEWVNNNLKLQKNCFGEDVVSDEQELTFAKFGKDKAIVCTYSYGSENFGIAATVVYYKDGKVYTVGNPSVQEPYHPGHSGFSYDFEKEAMISHYMHMGYYGQTVYKYHDGSFEKLADYEWAEFDDQGNFIENESGDPQADYTFIIGDEVKRGRDDFLTVEKMIKEDLKDYDFNIMDTVLTPENVDLILK